MLGLPVEENPVAQPDLEKYYLVPEWKQMLLPITPSGIHQQQGALPAAWSDARG